MLFFNGISCLYVCHMIYWAFFPSQTQASQVFDEHTVTLSAKHASTLMHSYTHTFTHTYQHTHMHTSTLTSTLTHLHNTLYFVLTLWPIQNLGLSLKVFEISPAERRIFLLSTLCWCRACTLSCSWELCKSTDTVHFVQCVCVCV